MAGARERCLSAPAWCDTGGGLCRTGLFIGLRYDVGYVDYARWLTAEGVADARPDALIGNPLPGPRGIAVQAVEAVHIACQRGCAGLARDPQRHWS